MSINLLNSRLKEKAIYKLTKEGSVSLDTDHVYIKVALNYRITVTYYHEEDIPQELGENVSYKNMIGYVDKAITVLQGKHDDKDMRVEKSPQSISNRDIMAMISLCKAHAMRTVPNVVISVTKTFMSDHSKIFILSVGDTSVNHLFDNHVVEVVEEKGNHNFIGTGLIKMIAPIRAEDNSNIGEFKFSVFSRSPPIGSSLSGVKLHITSLLQRAKRPLASPTPQGGTGKRKMSADSLGPQEKRKSIWNFLSN